MNAINMPVGLSVADANTEITRMKAKNVATIGRLRHALSMYCFNLGFSLGVCKCYPKRGRVAAIARAIYKAI